MRCLLIVAAIAGIASANPCGVVSQRVVQSAPVQTYAASTYVAPAQAVVQRQYVYPVGYSVTLQTYRERLTLERQETLKAQVGQARAEGIAAGMERVLQLMRSGDAPNPMEPMPPKSIVAEKCGSCHSGSDPKGGRIYEDGPYTWESAGAAVQQLLTDKMPRPTPEQEAAGTNVKLDAQTKQAILQYLYANIEGDQK